jgi:hypothetical protein
VNDHFQIGCLSKDYEYFASLTKEDAYKLDGDEGVEFWKNELQIILMAYTALKQLRLGIFDNIGENL